MSIVLLLLTTAQADVPPDEPTSSWGCASLPLALGGSAAFWGLGLLAVRRRRT